jgi:hypothetical protein
MIEVSKILEPIQIQIEAELKKEQWTCTIHNVYLK